MLRYAVDHEPVQATLWRQVAQTVMALDALDRGKPQVRKRRSGYPQKLPNHTMTTDDSVGGGLWFHLAALETPMDRP